MNLGKDLWEMFGASPPEPVKSPKLKWLEKHGLTTAFDAFYEGPLKWSCYELDMQDDVNEDTAGLGETEDEAILDACAKFGLKHWTVENL